MCFKCILVHTRDRPVCVDGCDSLPSVGVQRLGLLQQDALHQPGHVQVDVAGQTLQIGYVGFYPRQEVRGTADLLGGLVVIGHSHDDSGETCWTSVTCHWAAVGCGWTDGWNEPWWLSWGQCSQLQSFTVNVVFFFLKALILSCTFNNFRHWRLKAQHSLRELILICRGQQQ